MTIDEILRMAAQISAHAAQAELNRKQAYEAAYGARVAGAVDYRRRPDGVWEMPRDR